MLKILPQVFYESPDIQKLLVNGLSCAVYKRMEQPVWQKEGYVSVHALTVVLNGLLRIENADGLYVEVPANKMIFVPKGLYTISDIVPGKGCFEAVVFFFDNEVISDFIESIKLKSSKVKCCTPLVMDYTEPVRIFTESLLKNHGNNRKEYRGLTNIKLLELLYLVSYSQQTDCFLGALSTLNNKAQRGLKEFMHANFTKPLSIEDYAYLTGRSLSTFRRDFKTLFGGIAPKKWLIERRLERAHELLSKRNITVTEVVQEIGYENIPHFTKAFHAKYGIAPKQFVMQQRKMMLV